MLRYVNAGHNPQYVLRRDGRLEQMSSSGLPVGLLAGHGYIEERACSSPRETSLFFYTDGCVEAENESGEMFGAERLEALLETSAGAEDLLARVETAVKAFRGTARAVRRRNHDGREGRVEGRLMPIAAGTRFGPYAIQSLLGWRNADARADGFAAGFFQRLTDSTGLNESPAISPDGKMVAFVARAEGRQHVWILLLAGGPPLRITRDTVDHENPRWAPDSSSIIYFTPAPQAGEDGTILEVSALGGHPKPVISAQGPGDVSHDGERIAFFESRGAETIWSLLAATVRSRAQSPSPRKASRGRIHAGRLTIGRLPFALSSSRISTSGCTRLPLPAAIRGSWLEPPRCADWPGSLTAPDSCSALRSAAPCRTRRPAIFG